MPNRPTLARVLALPENRSALVAIQDLLFTLTEPSRRSCADPLFLHGPSGCGKTFLVSALAEELASCGICVFKMSANDFAAESDIGAAKQADLLIVEDLQHLPLRSVDSFIRLIDERGHFERPTIFSALVGPGRLQHRGTPYPQRLTSRLGAGLVVALDPLQAPSRRRLLKSLAEETKMAIAPDILNWFATHLTGGGRQLQGAIRQFKALQRLQTKPLRLADIRAHFRTPLEAGALTVQRIAERVSGYFHVAPKRLQSARRSRDVLLPRQVSMYLARQLTDLSLQKIGKFFGRRDHKTVHHACLKIEEVIKTDAVLSGAVRQMRAELA